MATPYILDLLSNLKTRVATNETGIADNKKAIGDNKKILDDHMADDDRHLTEEDRESFSRVTHFKGYYISKEKLDEAYPTAQLGDYAIVGDTDTVWVWDDTTNKWLNTSEQGTVISVNGKTGEVTLVKADVGLGNVDNTSDKDKPISDATQTALDGKADRKELTASELDSINTRAGIYSWNGQIPNGDNTQTSHLWTVIVGEKSNASSFEQTSQLWINSSADGENEVYVRRYVNGVWSDFSKVITDIEFDDVSTQVDTNKDDIADLKKDKADRGKKTLADVNGFSLRSGIYEIQEPFDILDKSYSECVLIVGEEKVGEDILSVTQLWVPLKDNVGASVKQSMFFRKIEKDESGNNIWGDFVEILTTNAISNSDIEKMKHFKGYYASLDDLKADAATGNNGDYAIVGTAIYVWDGTANEWSEISGAGSGGGAVTSVNGLTGDVVLTKTNIGLTNVDNTADADKEVKSATILKTGRTIDGVTFDGSMDISHFGICESGENSVTLNVNIPNFKKVDGAEAIIWFKNGVTPTTFMNRALNINGLGMANIESDNALKYGNSLGNKSVYKFVYDATNEVFRLVGDVKEEKLSYFVRLKDVDSEIDAKPVSGKLFVADSEGLYYEFVNGASFDITKEILVTTESTRRSYLVKTDNTGRVTLYSCMSSCGGYIWYDMENSKPRYEYGFRAYLKGTISGNIFTETNNGTLVTELPTIDDGYAYLSLGMVPHYASSLLVRLEPFHPVYIFKNGKLTEYTNNVATNSLTLTDGFSIVGETDKIVFYKNDTMIATLKDDGTFNANKLTENFDTNLEENTRVPEITEFADTDYIVVYGEDSKPRKITKKNLLKSILSEQIQTNTITADTVSTDAIIMDNEVQLSSDSYTGNTTN